MKSELSFSFLSKKSVQNNSRIFLKSKEQHQKSIEIDLNREQKTKQKRKMFLNKYLNKITNAVNNKNKENLNLHRINSTHNNNNNNNSNNNNSSNNNTTTINNNTNNRSKSINNTTLNESNLNKLNSGSANNNESRNLEYERAIAASYAMPAPKKKKPKINITYSNNGGGKNRCLSTDELAIIIRGPNRRHTLKETSSSNLSSSLHAPSNPLLNREQLLKARSSLTLNLSTSPSSGIYSASSCTGSTSLLAPSYSHSSASASASASASSSSVESLGYGHHHPNDGCATPCSSNASTPQSLNGGSGSNLMIWPSPTSATAPSINGISSGHLPPEFALLRLCLWNTQCV